MPVDYEAKKAFLNENDTFAKANGIRLEVLREGYAEAVLEANENSLNGLRTIQGGAIFTVADFAFAGGANSWGEKCIAMSAGIAFVRPGTGKVLRAVAKAVNKGRRSCLFDVEVFDEQTKLVAKVSFTGFFYEK
ncbi:MAG: Acyl-coenzyme A thioesterase PaaI [Lentisphaerae bacterium ADurb.Bin242]|nr:MAG: Acyl-coenzyme A thioesterase PaaI [Lentisphaerae bacterium ADurb.Bin242]